jgi:hypothetical protein
MRSSLFWDVTHRILVVTDVSGQPARLIFKGEAVQIEHLVVPYFVTALKAVLNTDSAFVESVLSVA